MSKVWLGTLLILCACERDRPVKKSAHEAVARPSVAAKYAAKVADGWRFATIDADGSRRVGLQAELASGGTVVAPGAPLFGLVPTPQRDEDEAPPPEEDEDEDGGMPVMPRVEPRHAQRNIYDVLASLQGDPSRHGFGIANGSIGERWIDAAVPVPGRHGVSGLRDPEPLHAHTIVIGAPTARAAALITALDEQAGCIGVGADPEPACLPFYFGGGQGTDARSVDLVVVALAADGVTVRTSDGQPFGTIAWTPGVDREALLEAHRGAMAAANEWWSAAIVTVDATVDVQHLVDVVAILLEAGVEAFGLRDWPVPPPRSVRIDPVVEGVDFDEDDAGSIRASLRRRLDRFEACPRTGAADAVVAFTIEKPGMVTNVRVEAPEPLRACVQQLLEVLEVPRHQWDPVIVTRATLHFRAQP